MRCYLFDIDGTLADLSHRLLHIQKQPKDWDAFFDACIHDAPIPHMIDVCRTLAQGSPIVFVSGRAERCRKATMLWLHNCRLYGELYMRANGDHRPDDEMKRELLDKLFEGGWEPIMAFDDRNRVVEMWRAQGIPCAQVADGNF